jgi:hypothetical protein
MRQLYRAFPHFGNALGRADMTFGQRDLTRYEVRPAVEKWGHHTIEEWAIWRIKPDGSELNVTQSANKPLVLKLARRLGVAV